MPFVSPFVIPAVQPQALPKNVVLVGRGFEAGISRDVLFRADFVYYTKEDYVFKARELRLADGPVLLTLLGGAVESDLISLSLALRARRLDRMLRAMPSAPRYSSKW